MISNEKNAERDTSGHNEYNGPKRIILIVIVRFSMADFVELIEKSVPLHYGDTYPVFWTRLKSKMNNEASIMDASLNLEGGIHFSHRKNIMLVEEKSRSVETVEKEPPFAIIRSG